jgi:hypothetical protein
MKVKVYVIDLPIPSFVKKWLRLGIPTFAILAGGVAFAGPPTTEYADGSPLTAKALTDNFTYLQTEITGLQGSAAVGAYITVSAANGATVVEGGAWISNANRSGVGTVSLTPTSGLSTTGNLFCSANATTGAYIVELANVSAGNIQVVTRDTGGVVADVPFEIVCVQ